MFDFFYRDARLTLLTIGLIVVAGLSSYSVMPRMEDPLLTKRLALINTPYPGADATRVESLVTEKLEEKLREVEEIKELRSFSRTGISTITVELRDDVYEVGPVWSRVRDKLADAQVSLPVGVQSEFDEQNMKAYAYIVSLNWNLNEQPNYAILRRLARDLENVLRAVPGTEDVDRFGDPSEEIRVTIEPRKLASLGLTAAEVSRQIRASDAKVSAGLLRSNQQDLLLEVQGELDSLARIEQIPIRQNNGQFVLLSDIAKVSREITDPPKSLALIQGRPAIAVAALVRSNHRVDTWTASMNKVLADYEAQLPRGIELFRVFEQNQYVAARLDNLLWNLLIGATSVVGVILLLMGWRSAVIVGLALPLSAFMVLAGMRFLNIPIHQMSVTGLIIALGLLIDNAIVVVDEVTVKIREGLALNQAVASSVRHLLIPLLGSTLTTAFAFAPIALMPGPAGEFVSAIAISVILAIFSSLFVSLTILPALTAWTTKVKLTQSTGNVWWRDGFNNHRLTQVYRSSLQFLFRRPVIGVLVSICLPILGFVQARHLQEQFFPPADRDQCYIELELPAHTSLEQTKETVHAIRNRLLAEEQVKHVHWFLGESAPSFYYNVITRRKNSSYYAQAMVQLHYNDGSRALIHRLQSELTRNYPEARILVRQLEQGPPFDAPVEVRLFGPDINVLQRLGEDVRLLMAQCPDVVHTRSDLSDVLPKLSFAVDESETRLVGLDHTNIADQLNATLEGAVGGSILEGSEEMPVRVRVGKDRRTSVGEVLTLELQGEKNRESEKFTGIPLAALAKTNLVPETATIPRLDNRRFNEVQAYINAGVLPSTVLEAFKEKLEASDFQLPPGYTLEFGGESAERNNAVGNLMANVGVLMVLMVATLVLTFSSFRMAGLIGIVGALSVGLGLGALWVFGYPFGFMAIIGTMGLIGVAINDSIVVLAALREDAQAKLGDVEAMTAVVMRSTRHVVATSLTTMVGFLPLVLDGGGFWPPLAVAISGGVGGATILGLLFIPSAYRLAVYRNSSERTSMNQGARQNDQAELPLQTLAVNS